MSYARLSPMKIMLIRFLAVFALACIINAAVIEPAICLSHDSASVQQQEDNCFVCQSSNYQWVNHSHFELQSSDILLEDAVSFLNLPLADSPVRSIFHPPHAF
jgi:hypothetical protein